MGEMLGNLWSSILFMIMFSGILMLVFAVIDYGHLYATEMAIEDNIKNGNYTYFEELKQDQYNPCTGDYPFNTNDNCSGIVAIDKANRLVTYQISFNGLFVERDASQTADHQVLLPY